MIVVSWYRQGFLTNLFDVLFLIGALRAAHVGIALSEAEASVVSPFTSRSKSPQSVVDLLKEGL